jgi:hypothetical protein
VLRSYHHYCGCCNARIHAMLPPWSVLSMKEINGFVRNSPVYPVIVIISYIIRAIFGPVVYFLYVTYNYRLCIKRLRQYYCDSIYQFHTNCNTSSVDFPLICVSWSFSSLDCNQVFQYWHSVANGHSRYDSIPR